MLAVEIYPQIQNRLKIMEIAILESTSFAERRVKLQKKRKILAAGGNRTESKFERDEEMEMVYLHCHDVTRPWLMTCDGLVCLPVPAGCVNVLNPSTGKSLVLGMR